MSSISQVSINDLVSEHREAFTQALHKVISSQPTQRALAQVVDGIPTRTDANGWEFVKAGLKRKDDPSEESIDTVKAFQNNFEVNTLEVSSDVAQAYQDTSIGSRDFKLRLLEIVAISFHDMVAHLFKSFEADLDAWPNRNRAPHPREATWFYHSDYLDHDHVSPIPFQTERYTLRIEPEEAMEMHIYRHLYERRPKAEDNGRTQHKRRRLEDYPEFGDLLQRLGGGEQW
ncbi:hypothetical protein BDV24DRAFT_158724 [Aspergillus arachidicola]|uniref:Uncharacterized protein n=1 Tax=Aspergillus arachidicola TaxID=656916 RepID=A0A5N6YNP7_9EURO|nr:hypothetical protein BDV24DRAFT_158724 [Aspergillus arachidicola]